MARSVKRVKRPPVRKRRWSAGAAAMSNLVAQNPAATGGSTALLVALFYVSANALWYQPHAHRDAWFPTRDFVMLDDAAIDPEPETTFLIERPIAPVSTLPADPVTKQVQGILKELGFYNGQVDGLSGPATSRAVDTYRRKVGLPPSAGIDQDLMVQLGLEPKTAGILPAPAPRGPQAKPAGDDQAALTMKVQAGLKAFGNKDIDVDGVMGDKTKNAIREFQGIFGLPVTGEPDRKLYVKMREAGLTN